MSKRLIILVALWLAATSAAADLVTGKAQPLPTIPHVQLKELLAQRRGQPVIINFWASWCAPCREEMPALQRLADRWQKRGLSVLTVAVADQAERATDFLWEISVSLPQLNDPDQAVARALDVRTLPTTLILDRRHRVVGRARGLIDWDDPAVEKQLIKLLH
jgi:thiol-disulfide isomerase/thioredoxin